MCNILSICNIPLKHSIWYMNLLTNRCLAILKLDPSGHGALPDLEHLGCPQQQKDALSQLSQGAPCRVQPGLLVGQGPVPSPSTVCKAAAIPRDAGAQGWDIWWAHVTTIELENRAPPGQKLTRMFGLQLAPGCHVHKHTRNTLAGKQTGE